MTMKQTQTKLFDFSDAGLDFCAGSKNLFPDRFKKMLALGYNEQTVSSAAVSGDQVTLTYGGAHGYKADRVLKVNGGTLSSINGGEFWIDSVTTNTVTFTLDNAPFSITGGFTTRIASLGWSLEYENANVHVYKCKKLDESDLYVRLCFQNVATNRNAISPCLGDSYNPLTGFITDANTYLSNAEILSPIHTALTWEYQRQPHADFNNATYDQGKARFGKAVVCGSLYHFVSLHNTTDDDYCRRVCAILPAQTNYYDQSAVLLGEISNMSMSAYAPTLMIPVSAAYVKNVRVIFTNIFNNVSMIEEVNREQQAMSSFVPASIDTFNTTTCELIPLYIASNGQHIGYITSGMYRAKYSESNTPPIAFSASPSFTSDIDLSSIIAIHSVSRAPGLGATVFFAVPIEEVKYA